MRVQTKEAAIRPTGDEQEFPGTFEVILSAPTKDRDGETLHADEWKQPLPEHITFDVDHGMSVQSTVGSGVPSLDDSGNLVVSGEYSSLPRAQEVRTLVREGHIRTTSVAFLVESPTSTKDGQAKVTRELLNGAFVAVPANRDALVLASKTLARKEGRRNSDSDSSHIQAIHDHAASLGASCESDSSGAQAGSSGGKAAGYTPQPYHADDDETVKCASCGKMNAPDARFCDQCGAKLPSSHEPYSADDDETIKCPQCGKLNSPDASYCDQCGTKLAGDPDVTDTSDDSSSSEGKSSRTQLAESKSSGNNPNRNDSAAVDSAAAADATSAAAADQSAADEVALRARALAIQAQAYS